MQVPSLREMADWFCRPSSILGTGRIGTTNQPWVSRRRLEPRKWTDRPKQKPHCQSGMAGGGAGGEKAAPPIIIDPLALSGKRQPICVAAQDVTKILASRPPKRRPRLQSIVLLAVPMGGRPRPSKFLMSEADDPAKEISGGSHWHPYPSTGWWTPPCRPGGSPDVQNF